MVDLINLSISIINFITSILLLILFFKVIKLIGTIENELQKTIDNRFRELHRKQFRKYQVPKKSNIFYTIVKNIREFTILKIKEIYEFMRIKINAYRKRKTLSDF